METSSNTKQLHTQGDHTMGFKLQIMMAVEKSNMPYKQAEKNLWNSWPIKSADLTSKTRQHGLVYQT
ncbi:hypothetical protein DFP81_1079 [Marinomonas pollencensis]|uniref:Uncharacterized protein n=1 Tax=Marinomonas pollencensis TaxID=491954 RepID=A0A3E0DJI4_9GAMM|nr:hypothetical protein DFP81_1079 [Marinomonas pollencensis]